MLNWDQIRTELDAKPWETIDGELDRRVFIGTAAHIMPSGKQYLPWSLENVACSVCLPHGKHCTSKNPCIGQLDGPNLHCAFCLDETFREALLQEAWKRNLYMTCDSEDAGDLYIGETKAT